MMKNIYKYEGEEATKVKSLLIQRALAEIEGDATKVEMLELALKQARTEAKEKR